MNKWKWLTVSFLVILVLGSAGCNSSKLLETETALASAQVQVSSLQTNLASVQGELDATNETLTTTENELTATKDELTLTAATLTQTQTQLKSTQSSLGQAQASLVSSQSELRTVKEQLAGITNGYGFVLNDPTYAAMKSFLDSDSTNTHTYDSVNYNCFSFSADVIANAAKQHLRCGFVSILFPKSNSHAIVVFNTIDKGIVYIEPELDAEVNLVTGQHYWQSIIISQPYYSTYDDTVQSFTIIW